MAQVVVEMSGDEAKLYRAFVKIMQGQDQVDQGFKKMKRSGEGMADSVAGKIVGMASSWLSVSAAINAATQAQEAYNRAVERAKQTHTDIAPSQREALTNLSITDPKAQEEMIAKVKAMQSRVQFAGGEAAAWRALSSAASAVGSDPKKSLEAAELAGELDPYGESTKDIAGAIGDLGKVGIGAKQARGYLLGIGKQARSTTQKQIGQNLFPAIAKFIKLGASPEQAGALVTALQQSMMDEEGSITKTAAMALAGSLEEYAPEKDEYEYDVHGKRTLKAKGTGVGADPIGKIMAIAADPKKLRFFMSQAKYGRDQGKVNIEELFGMRTNATWKLFQKNLAEFTPRDKWAVEADAQVETMNKAFSQRVARGAGVAEGQGELGDTAIGKTLAAEELWKPANVEAMLGDTNMGYLARKAAMLRYYASSSNLEAGSGILRERVTEMQGMASALESSAQRAEAGGFDSAEERRAAAADAREAANALQKKLDRMIEISQRQLDEVSAQRRENAQKAVPNTAPAM